MPLPIKVMVVYGTRPEAIKMAPIVQALAKDQRTTAQVVVTGQHREMLDQVNTMFGITPDLDLNIFQQGQSLYDVTQRTLVGMNGALTTLVPDVVVVQGDTTTTFSAALAAFYSRRPVVHTEAGLRTNDRWSPFPEEINRRLTTQLAELHLAPTEQSRANLLRDGVAEMDIQVTGNSVIDALLWTTRQPMPAADPELASIMSSQRRIVLVTTHRRESWGAPMRQVASALARLANAHPDHHIVVPVHRNPVVREAILPALKQLPNASIIEPLAYGHFCHLMERAHIILTDSGGIQEEGPSLGKPVLVLRENTERPEAVEAGTVRLVGTDEDTVFAEANALLADDAAYARMSMAQNPYGDGTTALQTVQAIVDRFGH